MAAMMPPVIDWAAHKEPWRSIGLAFRAQCEAIAKGETPPPAPRPSRKLATNEVPREGA